MRRNSVSVEEGIVPRPHEEPVQRKQRPEKLFLRSASVGLAPGDGEQSPSPGPTTKSPPVDADRKQNRRESIKGHLMKFKAKAGKILEEKSSKLAVQDEQNSLSFVSQTESELREELSIVDESEPSIQQENKKEQLRNRIRKSAQKAVERTRGNVQLSRRLARRPTVVMEEHLDENDLNAIDEQIERTIKMGEKYLVANEDTLKEQKDIDEFFQPKDIPAQDQKSSENRKLVYGRVEEVKYQHDLLVKYVQKGPRKTCGQDFPTDALSNVKIPPSRVEYHEDSASIYTAPEPIDNTTSRERGRNYVQLDVFVDSIHFDQHSLWGEEEVAAAEFRNEQMMQGLRLYETKQLVMHQLDIERQPEMKEEVRKGRIELERLAGLLEEIRKKQGYTATTVEYTPAEQPWDTDDWSSSGKVTQSATLTPIGKIPKESRQRILSMQKTTIQLILYFNDVKVASTKWIPLSCNLMSVQRRFELEFYSPLKSLTLEVVERLNGKTRVIGRASVPLPSDEDLDVALHEVEFECDTNYMAGTDQVLRSNSQRKECGRILCRTILEDGELKFVDDQALIDSSQENIRSNKMFELIHSELLLGDLHENDSKRRLEELREEDRAQKRFTYRSAIDSRRNSALQFANLARKRVMDRRQRREKKYEEIVREPSIPTLSVAFSQLFGPADVSRRLKPMRKEAERNKEEGWDKTIVVNIQSAINLPVRNSGQLQPFVVVSYGDKRINTDAAVGRHPNWQSTCKLIISKEDRNEEFIEFRIYDQLVEEIDKDDRITNVVHEHLAARLLATQKIRFETLATASKISAPIRLNTPLFISNYKQTVVHPSNCCSTVVNASTVAEQLPSFTEISTESSFLKVLLSTQIDPKSQVEYTKSPSSFETQKTLEKCEESEKKYHEMFSQRIFRPLVTDLNAHSTVCTRFLRPLLPPSVVIQENSSNLPEVVRLAAKIVSGIPRVDATSHSDIWANAFQLTSIAAGGLEERSTLLACWLLHFRLPVAVVLGESRGEKTGFVLTELDTKQVLIDPMDGHIYQTTDANCGLEKIYGAFDVKNYYGNVQQYDQSQQVALNFTKTPHWKPLFAAGEELLESVQPASLQYTKVSEDWIVELRIALEREIKLRFDETRKHAIPQWHLVAARQLREILEAQSSGSSLENLVEEKMGRLKDGYSITVIVLRMNYVSMTNCVQEVLSTRLQDSPNQNVQFALAVHVVDYFAHVIQVDIALAVLKHKK